MIKRVYGVFDKQAGFYPTVLMVRHESEAIRSFQNLCSDKTIAPGQEPEGFALHRLANFDDVSGLYVQEGDGPIRVMFGHEALAARSKESEEDAT